MEDLPRLLREEIASWEAPRPPSFEVLLARAAMAPPRWVIYPVASAALAAILLVAFLVMVNLHLGSLGAAPVQSHLP
jgi:hypothetical protein